VTELNNHIIIKQMELKIDDVKAKKLYPEAPEWFKKELEEKFSKYLFLPKVYEKIKTFEDALKGSDVIVEFNNDSDDEIAYKKLKVIVSAINNGWKPDWNNSDERKWFPVFILSSGFGFDDSSYGYALAGTGVGSRLCFQSEEQSDYAANQFIEIYKDLLT